MSGEVRLTLRLPRIATAKLKCGCPVEVPLPAIPFERPLQGTVDGHRAFVAHRCVSVIAISMVSPHYFLLPATTRSVTIFLLEQQRHQPARAVYAVSIVWLSLIGRQRRRWRRDVHYRTSKSVWQICAECWTGFFNYSAHTVTQCANAKAKLGYRAQIWVGRQVFGRGELIFSPERTVERQSKSTVGQMSSSITSVLI